MSLDCNTSCSGSCEGDCGNDCYWNGCKSGCSTTCGSGCGESCSGSCSSCGGCDGSCGQFYCENGCKGGCIDLCTSACGGNCIGGCSGCTGSCTQNCADDCSGKCKGSCSGDCNNACTAESQPSTIANLDSSIEIGRYIRYNDFYLLYHRIGSEHNRRGIYNLLDIITKDHPMNLPQNTVINKIEIIPDIYRLLDNMRTLTDVIPKTRNYNLSVDNIIRASDLKNIASEIKLLMLENLNKDK